MNKKLKSAWIILLILFCGINTASAQGQNATGLVTDENGEPMIGVQISIEGTTTGVITDVNGNFMIKAKKGEILVFTYVGYMDQKINYKGEKILAIKMLPSTEMLEDVVVIGYGKQKKNSVVSSVNSIGVKELAVSSSRNLTNNLAGQIPGLIAVQRSGEPGYDNSEFWIRGISSFKGGTNPLVLVDGVPREMQDIETDEIESFTLLKDAAATAVYGAEGANGVILITSKRGSAQKPKFTFRAETTMLTPTRLPEFMNSEGTLNLYNEALFNDNGAGYTPYKTAEEIAKYASHQDLDLYPDTDWIDGMLRDHTYNMRYTLGIRGGTERARYFVSGAYYKENGIFKNLTTDDYDNNIGLERYNLRSNIDFDATKTTLIKVDISGQYLLTNYPGVGTSSIFRGMCMTPPFLMPMVYSDGTAAGHPRHSGNRVNPYNQLVNSGYTKEWRTSIQSKVEINQKLDFVTKGLSWKAAISFDGDMSYIRKRTKNLATYRATGRDENGGLTFEKLEDGTSNLSDATITNSSDKKIYFETSLNYSRTFAQKHDVGAMFLYMQKETQKHDVALPYRKQGLVGRVTYGYDGRYFIEGNFGYTGSEAFAAGHRFGFFPAVGLAWYISNEPYYPEALKSYVSKLKLRVSVGRTGNDDTGSDRFLYRGTMVTDKIPWYNTGYNNNGSANRENYGTGLVEGLFSAPYLSWEIEDKQNYGIDLGLFDNRVDIQVDYFKSRRKSILLQRSTVSNITGFQKMPWQNFGIVDNHGVDASITFNQQIGEVKLSARGNFTFARNEIIEYDQAPQNYAWMEKKGTRLRSWGLYIADGLYTDNDFNITGDPGNPTYTLKPGVPSGLTGGVKPGDIKYKDLNGDGKIDSYDKMEDVGNPSVPEIVYGFGFNAEWKGFYAGVFFQGSGNTSTVLGADNPEAFFPFKFSIDETSVRNVVTDRWTQENPSQNVMFPRLHSTNFENNTAASTWWLRNASFLRFKNIEFGYNFPQKMIKNLRLEALRIYFQGNNICVWDHIKMWDPEQGNSNGGFPYPLNRTFTLGVDFTF